MRFRRKQLVGCSLVWTAAISLSGCTSLDKISFKNPFRPKTIEVQRQPLIAAATKAISVTTVGYSKVVEAAEPITEDSPV